MQSRGTTNQRECSGGAGTAHSFKPLLRRTTTAVTDTDISPLLRWMLQWKLHRFITQLKVSAHCFVVC
ncbi:hypothetical protein MHYP_G00154020 [Metynnis hypsauchen]